MNIHTEKKKQMDYYSSQFVHGKSKLIKFLIKIGFFDHYNHGQLKIRPYFLP